MLFERWVLATPSGKAGLGVANRLPSLLADRREGVSVSTSLYARREVTRGTHVGAEKAVVVTPVVDPAFAPVSSGDLASFAIESDAIELPADNFQRGGISRLRAAIDQHRPEGIHDERPAA